ncbi:hypothetical protein ETH_00043415 [Eimeria tenella]|uniref:Uncharacterized protein n=1 Tax=Eimeria tenella TaxID=5802 RepID=U6KTE9_EIMTE|nr:hypothetical protein ETH_00043415 [Eimeria tenella]CDJ40203.1 hypothetical protein ETH_00043415 [Eimeria tenella]|eukprot:XP_013230956.1 hypothetical protein ETH_00043415 [Eimeria tenella]
MPQHFVDYLHRVGRLSRGAAAGKVTALHRRRDRPLLQEIMAATAAAAPAAAAARPAEQLQLQQQQLQHMEEQQQQQQPALSAITFVNSRTRRILKLQRRWQQLLDMKMKAEKKLAELQKRGIIRKSHKLPRRPDSVIERCDAQQIPKVQRGADGHMQFFGVRRSRRKQEELRMQQEAGRYEDPSITVPLEKTPKFSETKRVGERRPLFA